MAIALDDAADEDEAVALIVEATGKMIRRARSVILTLADPAGRLRRAAAVGAAPSVRRRTGRRRGSLDSGTPQILDLRSRPGEVVAFFPLCARGLGLGVLEIVARREAVDAQTGSFCLLADRAALGLATLRDRQRASREIAALSRSADFAAELIAASTLEGAVHASTVYCHSVVGAPVAGWISRGFGQPFVLIATEGLAPSGRNRLASHIPVLARGGQVSPAWRRMLAERFAVTLGLERSTVIALGRVVLAFGGASRPQDEALERLLRGAFEHRAVVESAQRRNEELDNGLAWTAHELRRPVAGATAVLEHLSGKLDVDEDRNQAIRAGDELAKLSHDLDTLLGFAVGERTMKRRHTDLRRLIDEAIAVTSPKDAGARIRVRGPLHASVLADRVHVRAVLVNVLNNALECSGKEPVTVTVVAGADHATVNVRDRGPGISAADRDRIFDPFVRGDSTRSGTGLGLFISRRILEEHEGAIWVDPVRRGASLTLQLPTSRSTQRKVSSSGS